jgi:hypothetical protein
MMAGGRRRRPGHESSACERGKRPLREREEGRKR